MADLEKLDSVGFHQVRSEYVDWGSKSASPDIRQFTDHLSYLLAEARGLVPGPASEMISEVEETTASQFSNETNRVIRVTANCAGNPVEFDIIVQLAAPTAFVFPGE
ncbi:hypothetical protein HEK616_09720 [Streptomyces nigrescens]|uniref:Uncharacterized protein n=1 Tax=Streptomyces nigrescens TaxID=1920 RepID=A0ABM7ZNG6_STRNI|nr:hypothetical protein [Streptomyces nigrescens]BDM67485.1 hypothetical protein HEK616_09720 [Streptomyces nigrescens]